MTTRTKTRAQRNTMRDARDYTSHDVLTEYEMMMMNAHNDTRDDECDVAIDMCDALTREYGDVLYTTNDDTTTTTNDEANITRARIARKLTKRDRAMLRKMMRDDATQRELNIAHEHNTRWHDVVFDVRVLQRAKIEYKIVE